MALDALEAESIEILREAVAAAERPVLLYSIGKDSSVLLQLARKAFHPGPLPFPLLHVDTGWKFKAMYAHRDRMMRETGSRLIVYRNEAGCNAGFTKIANDTASTSLTDTGVANGLTYFYQVVAHPSGTLIVRGSEPRPASAPSRMLDPENDWSNV